MRRSILLVFICILCFCSCNKKVGPTTIEIEDSMRHYYPMVLGDELELSYKLTNTGKEPFIVTDIQPSCGCIVEGEKNERIILPDKALLLHFRFYSGKNVGYVRHTIRVFGNVKPNGCLNLVFDVNVVPPSDNTPDYEEIYKQKQDNEKALLKDKVNGTTAEKGYYIDVDSDSRSQKQFFWR